MLYHKTIYAVSYVKAGQHDDTNVDIATMHTHHNFKISFLVFHKIINSD